MTRSEENFIDEKVREALSRKNLPHNHVVADVLRGEAQFAGSSLAIITANGAGLDQRIEQLREHPQYRHTFPADPPKLAKSDMQKMSENFSKIASGEVEVR